MIETTEPNINIIFIDTEKLEFDDLKDYKDLYLHIIKKTNKSCKNVVMIDEMISVSYNTQLHAMGVDSHIDW